MTMANSFEINHNDKDASPSLTTLSEAPETTDTTMAEETAQKFVHLVVFSAKVKLTRTANDRPASKFIRKVIGFIIYECPAATITSVHGAPVSTDDFPFQDSDTKKLIEYDDSTRNAKNLAFGIQISTTNGYYELRNKLLSWLKQNNIFMRNLPLASKEVHVSNIGILTGINPYIIHRGDFEKDINAKLQTALTKVSILELENTLPGIDTSAPIAAPFIHIYKQAKAGRLPKIFQTENTTPAFAPAF
jgi:hypothetical protein